MLHLPSRAAIPLRAGLRGALALTLAILAGAGDSRAAGDRAFRTAGGAVVEMVPVDALDCAGLDAKLSEIDRTGFRGNGPVPLHAQDQPLYLYERKVANTLYTRCAGDSSDERAKVVMRRGLPN